MRGSPCPPAKRKGLAALKEQVKVMDGTVLIDYLDDFLCIREIRDDSCNGLQVEGRGGPLRRVALAVDFCLETAEAAAREKADMLIVHHGLIWGGLKSIRGPVYRRVKCLLEAGIGLYAAHLPLDMHPLVGNNAELARILKMKVSGPFGTSDGQSLGLWGELEGTKTLGEITSALATQLGASCKVLSFGTPEIRSLGIISGGAARYVQEAIEKKLDAYLTGESSHSVFHTAQEACINVIYGGHYATETPGIRALGKHVEEKFGLDMVFIDIPTGF
jgi:dinuclear metal center YbgI/SA1388 family protein